MLVRIIKIFWADHCHLVFDINIVLCDHMKQMLGRNFSTNTHHTEIALEVVVDFKLMRPSLLPFEGGVTGTWPDSDSDILSFGLRGPASNPQRAASQVEP